MNLLRTIAHCPNIQRCYDTGQGACCSIIKLQSSYPATKKEHQVPEPWSGNIEHAPILFIGPNPHGDGASPDKKQPAFPLWGWEDEEIEEFFTQRYNQDKDKPWILGGTRYLLQDGKTYSTQEVTYWVAARGLAQEALGRDIQDGEDYALTEVVHCQSNDENAIKPETLNECAKRYLQPVLALSGAKVLVVLGSKARIAMERTFKAELKGVRGRAVGPVQISGRQRYVAYVPHPNYCDRRIHQPCTFERWLDVEAFQALQAFLRK
jgi:uracil-DNA glycosylase